MEQAPPNHAKELVFVSSDGVGAFLTRYHFQLLVNYKIARENAKTWGDFKTIIGRANFTQFYEVFLLSDSYEPSDGDVLDEIAEDVWLLNDSEFPATQCAEETTSLVGDYIPLIYRLDRLTTEYGRFIDFYSVDEIENIKAVLQAQGMMVEVCNLPFSFDVRDYG
ncbi:hypothetical protein [Marinobacter nauticus]|uniref:hypothetical protein n=1 Tax=Marinobacter nauticus TaxID=2743 RepID=UPI001CFD549C|nr:hypothetical protein [Marinobacter nauticus]